VIAGADPAQRPLLLLDTHALVWSMNNNPKLGLQAKEAIRRAYREKCAFVSAITPWEIGLLVSKGRLRLGDDVMQWIRAAMAVPGVQLAPLELEIAVASTRLPFEMHPDPADRIIVATARYLGATLVTADKALLDFSRNGHFKTLDATA